jgi:hypothetical protein
MFVYKTTLHFISQLFGLCACRVIQVPSCIKFCDKLTHIAYVPCLAGAVPSFYDYDSNTENAEHDELVSVAVRKPATAPCACLYDYAYFCFIIHIPPVSFCVFCALS